MRRVQSKMADRPPRGGFTLIELLAVMAVMAILITLAVGGLSRYISGQMRANTQTRINTLRSATQRQWSLVVDKARKETRVPPAVAALAGDANRTRVILSKIYVKQAFPMNFDEVMLAAGPGLGVPAIPSFKTELTRCGVSGTTAGAEALESSVLLLLALERNGVLRREDLGPGAVGILPNGLSYIQDGWGNPIAFCRWPTGNNSLNPGGNPQAGIGNDPEDPMGLLTAANWLTAANIATFSGNFHAIPDRSVGPRSFTLRPMIASPGPDAKLGMNAATFQEISSDANDNVTTENIPG